MIRTTIYRAWRVFVAYGACGLGSSAVMLLLLAEFHEDLADPWLAGLDQRLTGMIHGWTTAPLTRLMLALTTLGSWWVLGTAVAGGVGWMLRRRERVASAGLLVALGGAGVLNTILKFWFGRQRPDLPWSIVHEQSFSFPSGHAMTALVCYGMLAYLACRRCRGAVAATAAAATAALILGIGVSRIYLGVHYPSDIMAGYAGGVLWLLTVIGGLAALPRLTPARDADREAACPRG